MFKIFVISLLIGILASQLTTGVSACPSKCNCSSSANLQCLNCLQSYNRMYDSQNNNCPCFPIFTQLEVPDEHCCSKTCKVCTSIGNCAQCFRNWTLMVSELGLRVCVCRQNFYFDGIDCRCFAQLYPTAYYWVEAENSCYACPQGCECTVEGCISCDVSTNRTVTTLPINSTKRIYTCSCMYPFEETAKGCTCPQDCNCTNKNISCSSFYRFKTVQGLYYCRPMFTQTNSACACLYPYTLSTDTYECMCSSRFNPTSVYENMENQCTPCPPECVCNDIGCTYCSSYSNRKIVGNSCPCKPPFREINGTCECYAPFFYNRTLDQCSCLNKVYPTRYYHDYFSSDTVGCRACPQGCECTNEGCVKCDASAFRKITRIQVGDSNYSMCLYCVNFAFEQRTVCKCIDQSQSTPDGQCGCTTNMFYYYQNQTGKCNRCPYGCSCTQQKGCFACPYSHYRKIVADSVNMAVCGCTDGARVGDIAGNCYCSVSTNQSDEHQCLCELPYYMNNAGQCRCTSQVDSISYYNDQFGDECMACPAGCACNSTGCIQCNPNALRNVYSYRNILSCPCLQIAGLPNSSCKACLDGWRYFNGECIPCGSCQTCDWTGKCMSCRQDATLVNGSECVCNIAAYQNINGKCGCLQGFYYNESASQCMSCPRSCYDCILAYNSAIPKCIVCADGMHRKNEPANGCPCIEEYFEVGSGVMPYCCNQKCLTCNETGCTSCEPITYRQLNSNQSCVCLQTFTQVNNSLICVCNHGLYLYGAKCFPCPVACDTCEFGWNNSVSCLTCRTNSNRNTAQNNYGVLNCYCLPNFIDNNYSLPYCYARYCLRAEIPCTACSANRVPTNDGSQCACAYGYFEDSSGLCEQCQMEGCIVCSSLSFCSYCNESNGYFLTGATCKKLLPPAYYLYSQNVYYIIIQFLNKQINTSYYNIFVTAIGQLQKIYPSPLSADTKIVDTVSLKSQIVAYTSNQTVTAVFKHPDAESDDVILAVRYILARQIVSASWYSTADTGSYVSEDAWVYIKLNKVYSAQKMKFGDWSFRVFLRVLIAILLFVCASLYIQGFKHNQTLFFLQTLHFLSFVIYDEYFRKIIHLYNLGWIQLGIGNYLTTVTPEDYFESSHGNFTYLTGDSNFFRLTGTTTVIATSVAGICIVLRIIWCICRSSTRMLRNTEVQQLILTRKKFSYRLLEFLYKACMYPLIFYSLITFFNWNAVVLTSYTRYHNLSRGTAIAFFSAYAIVTIYQIWFETIAKINKIEHALEFGSDCLASLILCLSMHKNTYLFLLVLIAFRAGVYVMIRRIVLRDFHKIEYLKLLSALMECITIALTVSESWVLTVLFTVATVLTQLTHSIAVTLLTSKSAQFNNQMPESVIIVESNKVITLPEVSESIE